MRDNAPAFIHSGTNYRRTSSQSSSICMVPAGRQRSLKTSAIFYVRSEMFSPHRPLILGLLIAAPSDSCATRQRSGSVKALPYEPSGRQTSGCHSGLISRGWPHSAFQILVFQSDCGHTQEVWWNQDHGQLPQTQQHQHVGAIAHTPC